MQAKLENTEINSVIKDFEYVDDNESLKLVKSTLRLSANVLAEDKNQLAGQLLGRLMDNENPEIRVLLEKAIESQTGTWLRPQTASFIHPGGGLLRTFTGHTKPINAILITSDGKLGISASLDGTIRFWDLESESHTFTYDIDNGEALSLALFPNERQLLCGTNDGRLLRIELDTGTLTQTYYLEKYINEIRGLAITPINGDFALVGSSEKLVIIDLATGDICNELVEYNHGATHIAISPDAKKAYAGGIYDNIATWELETGENIRSLRHGTDSWVSALALSNDGSLLMSGDWEGRVIIWLLNQPHTRLQLYGHGDWKIRGLAISSDRKRAISVAEDQRMIIWDLEQSIQKQDSIAIKVIPLFNHKVTSISLTLDGQRVLTAGEDNNLKLWGLDYSGELIHHPSTKRRSKWSELYEHKEQKPLWSAKSDIEVDVLYTRDEDGDRTPKRVKLTWSDRPNNPIFLEQESYSAAAISADQKVAAFASDKLTIWDLDRQKELKTIILNTNRQYANWIVLNPDGSRAAVFFRNGIFHIWDLRNEMKLTEVAEHKYGQLTDKDSLWVCALVKNTYLQVIGIEEANIWLEMTAGNGEIESIIPNEDPNRLMLIGKDGTLSAWDMEGLSKSEVSLSDRGIQSIDRRLLHLEGGSGITTRVLNMQVAIQKLPSGEMLAWDISTAFQKDEEIIQAIKLGNLKTPYPDNYDVILLDNGKLLLLMFGDKLQVWDSLKGEHLASFRGDYPFSSASFNIVGGKVEILASDSRTSHRFTLEGVNIN